jgi:hypothetical protein
MEFNKNKEYKFSKAKYLQNPVHKSNYDNNQFVQFWVNYMDARKVVDGLCAGYPVQIEYCDEGD